MKKLTGFIRSNAKVLAAVTITAAVSSSSVYAATILLNANQVGFDKTNTSLSSTDVQGALNELHTRVSTWIPPIQDMQNFDKTTLSSTGSTAVLRDTRDGNTYVVRKLADGNVWMIQDLKLGGGKDMTLTPSDSDVTSDYTLPEVTTDSASFSQVNKSNVFVDGYSGYYTFHAATAGWGTTDHTSGDSPTSICPKGWRLPTGGPGGEFETLYNLYGDSIRNGEPNFVNRSGTRRSTFQESVGYLSVYRSSTVRNSSSVFSLSVQDSTIDPATWRGVNYGVSIRCIAR